MYWVQNASDEESRIAWSVLEESVSEAQRAARSAHSLSPSIVANAVAAPMAAPAATSVGTVPSCTANRCSPRTAASARAWHRQPPQSFSRRSQERQGSFIQSVPR